MELIHILSRLYAEKARPVSITPLEGNASSRKYHRVQMLGGHTLVVMELPENAFRSDEASEKTRNLLELPFVNMARFLIRTGLRIPSIYLDAAEDGAVLVEDLGDTLFIDKVNGQDTKVNRDWYFAAVDTLVALHKNMWPIPEGCVARDRHFDFDLLRWELDHYREWGAEARLNRRIDPALREDLDREFDALARTIEALPRGFVHRDYQSKNLMVVGEHPNMENIAIIDFQDALEGPRVYDLVALLNDSYVDVELSLKEKAIRQYANQMNLDFETLKQEFFLVTVQRKLKDAGRFIFLDREKGNPSFLQYVDASLRRVGEALASIPGLDGLRQNLAKIDPDAF